MLPLSLVLAAGSVHANILPIEIGGMLCHPRNLMVKIDDPTALESVESAGAKVLRHMPQIGWAVVEAPVGKLQATREKLETRPGISSVTFDRAGKVAYTPNDAKWPDQWHMRAIKANLAWDTTLGSDSVVVAVLDTGVQVNHPDLAANMWVNPGEVPGNAVDDDGNGFVDDVNGYDFAFNDGNPNDDHGHGTACAGIVAGVGDNSIGVSGVAPRAKIMAIKNANTSGYFYDSYTVPSYIYAADMRARVFSMSYYSDRVSQAEEDALKYAQQQGVLPIAAAGNDSTVYSYYPAAYDVVLSVAAVDGNLNKAGFSDWGSWVDVAAPGTGLTTTARNSSYTDSFGGTSGACPHVAGLAALLLGANPAVTGPKLRRTIEDTATELNQAPFGIYSNYGLVNAQAAMAAITGPTPKPKSPLVRAISPIGIRGVTRVVGKVYGRSLIKSQVNVGGTAAKMLSKARDYATYELPVTGGNIDVQVSGTTVTTFTPPVPTSFVYPLIEASTKGATLEGGFVQTLNDDGVTMRVTRRSDKLILVEGTFRNLPRKGRYTLILDRLFLNSTVGAETVQLYNWASNSYPYGNFDTLFTRAAVDSTPLRTRVVIPEIAPYVDFEGTVYLRILAEEQPSGAELRLDQAFLWKGSRPTA